MKAEHHSEATSRARALLDDLREAESDAERDRHIDSARLADVLRRAIIAIELVRDACDELRALLQRVETLETALQFTVNTLDNFAVWRDDDMQGLRYHAMQEAKHLRAALATEETPHEG